MNLPMLIKLANLSEQADLLTAAREIREQTNALGGQCQSGSQTSTELL